MCQSSLCITISSLTWGDALLQEPECEGLKGGRPRTLTPKSVSARVKTATSPPDAGSPRVLPPGAGTGCASAGCLHHQTAPCGIYKAPSLRRVTQAP